MSCLILLDACPDPPGETEAYKPYPPIPSGLASPWEIVDWATPLGWTDGVDRSDLDRWLIRHARWSLGGGWGPGFDEGGYQAAYTSARMWQSNRAHWRDVARIACPTLAVVGEKERGGVGEELGKLLVERLREGSLSVVPDTGHLLHWQNLSATLAAVRPFLAVQG